jgi:hypothetical protein
LRKSYLNALKIFKKLKRDEESKLFQKKNQSSIQAFLCDCDPWKYIRSLMGKIKDPIKPRFSLADAVSHFTNLYSDNDDLGYTYPDWLKPLAVPASQKPLSEFSLPILTKILKMKRNWAAPGPDGLFNILFKKIPSIHASMISLFEKIRKDRVYPQTWKHGKVVLIHKKDDPSIVKNFRPICLTDAISKIFTQYLVIHASRHMRFNKFMCTTQKEFLEDISGCIWICPAQVD